MNTYVQDTAEPANIRSQIDATRQRMDGNINALTDRLKGKHLLDEVLGFFRTSDGHNRATELTRKISHSTEQAMKSVGDSIKANPIPLLLIGAGIGWAVYAHNKKTRATVNEDWGNFESDNLHRARSSPSNGTAEGKMHQAVDRTKEAFRTVGGNTQQLAHQTKEQVSRTVQEHPLSMGLGCLAAGIVAGILIPTPAVASRALAAPAARLRQEAERVGEELVERGNQMAATAAEAVTNSTGNFDRSAG